MGHVRRAQHANEDEHAGTQRSRGSKISEFRLVVGRHVREKLSGWNGRLGRRLAALHGGRSYFVGSSEVANSHGDGGVEHSGDAHQREGSEAGQILQQTQRKKRCTRHT